MTFATSIACCELFIPESLDGIERGGAPSRIRAERERHDGREDGRDQMLRSHGIGATTPENLTIASSLTSAADRDAEEQADQAAETRQRQRLDEELQQHLNRVAPIALRRPISRVRSATLTSMMLRMPIPATSSETAPISATTKRDAGEEAVDALGERLAVERLVLDAPAFEVVQPGERVGFGALDLDGSFIRTRTNRIAWPRMKSRS